MLQEDESLVMDHFAAGPLNDLLNILQYVVWRV